MGKKAIITDLEAANNEQFNNLFKRIKLFETSEVAMLVSMADAICLMEKAFASFSDGRNYVPRRYISNFPGLPMDLFFKPVYCNKFDRIAVKILTQKQGVTHPGIPTIIGIVLLFDSVSGEILSLIDGTYLTALRTGAASGIATQYLARKEAETVAIFGCGAQGLTQVEAVCNVRPIQRVLLYDLNQQAAIKLRDQLQEKMDIKMSVEKGLGNLKKAEVICTATGSKLPLFSRNDMSNGVHINAIGSFKPDMQEICPQIIKSSRLFVDSRDAVLKEAGDLIIPIKKGVIKSNFVRHEIGDLINGKSEGRQSPEEITLFKSVGIAVQDLFVANAVYDTFHDDDLRRVKS